MDRPIATDPPFFYSSSAIHIDNQFYHNNHHHLQHHGAHHQQQQHHNHQQPSRQPQSAHSMHRDFDQAIPTRAANDSPVGPEGYSISRRGTMGSLHHQRSHERLALDMDLSETRPPSIAGPSTGRSAGSTSSSFAHGHPHHPQNRPHEGHGYDSAVSSPMDVVGSSHTHAHSHGHSQPSASVPTGGLNVQPAQEQPPMDEEPLYVNAKQYYRILKRRVARARLEELHRLSKQRKPYLHESRHKHAMRRPRGPGGRFLTADEIAAQKAIDEAAGARKEDDHDEDGDEDEVMGVDEGLRASGSPPVAGTTAASAATAKAKGKTNIAPAAKQDSRSLSLIIPESTGSGANPISPASGSPHGRQSQHGQGQRIPISSPSQHGHGHAHSQGQSQNNAMLHPGYGNQRAHSSTTGGRSPASEAASPHSQTPTIAIPTLTTTHSPNPRNGVHQHDGGKKVNGKDGGSVNLSAPYPGVQAQSPHSPHPSGGSSSYFLPSHSHSSAHGHAHVHSPIDPQSSPSISHLQQHTQQQHQQQQHSGQLHHVPHPHAHHAHTHPRHTHVHSQPHPSEAGSLYNPYGMPSPVDFSLLFDSSGASNSQDGVENGGWAESMDMGIGVGAHPGSIRIGGSGLSASAQADLQRRTDEILAISARSGMGGGGLD